LSPIIIHFFGPDGAGKSTQVNLLVSEFLSKRIKVRKYWIRSPHTLAYVLWKVSLKIGFFRTVSNKSGAYIKVPAVHRNRVLGRLWSLVELVSILPLVVRANLYLLSGYTLIAERYVLDTIAFVAFSINDSGFLQSPISWLFLALIPAKTKFIFVDADYDTIVQRRVHFLNNEIVCSKKAPKKNGSAIKTELEPREFIDFQRILYKTIAQANGALVINTSKHSPKETFNLILDYLNSPS
jgi:hypothetical protein